MESEKPKEQGSQQEPKGAGDKKEEEPNVEARPTSTQKPEEEGTEDGLQNESEEGGSQSATDNKAAFNHSPGKRKSKTSQKVRKQPKKSRTKQPKKSGTGSDEESNGSLESAISGKDDSVYKGPKIPTSPKKRPTRMLANRVAAMSQGTKEPAFKYSSDASSLTGSFESPNASDNEEVAQESLSARNQHTFKTVDVQEVGQFVKRCQTKGYAVASLKDLVGVVYSSWKLEMLAGCRRKWARCWLPVQSSP